MPLPPPEKGKGPSATFTLGGSPHHRPRGRLPRGQNAPFVCKFDRLPSHCESMECPSRIWLLFTRLWANEPQVAVEVVAPSAMAVQASLPQTRYAPSRTHGVFLCGGY
uniref:Uncharacterized protein n=1 Tax=Eutreptiella gymnastica TaxID=73025 RepID=A0A7S4FS03_9EUGL